MTAPLYDADGRPLGPFGPFEGAQAAAVRRRSGSLLVSANAGAGKTTVLAERYARMVAEDELEPREILAVTFTDKAAGELKVRVRRRLIELGCHRAAHQLDRAPIGTFHGLCARILRANALRAGVDPGFSVLGDAETRSLSADAWGRALATVLDGAEDAALDVFAVYGVDELRSITFGTYAALRSRGQRDPALPSLVTPPPRPDSGPLAAAIDAAQRALAGSQVKTAISAAEGFAACGELLAAGSMDPVAIAATIVSPRGAKILTDGPAAAARELQQRYVGELWAWNVRPALIVIDALLRAYGETYTDGKREAGALDFEDLELGARDLLRAEPAIAARYRERHRAVMVDEFQDTNPVQMQLLQLLGDERFAVGDELQSIYGFRHADVAIFRAERERLGIGGGVVQIAENYRSRPEILTLIDAALGPVHGDGYVSFRPACESAGDGPRVELLLAGGEADANAARLREHEAALLAERIRELTAGGTAPGEIVVLMRALSDVAIYKQALEQAGVPAVAAGGGFWARTQTLELCGYLALLANPGDEAALFGVLCSPLCGVSADALALIAAGAPSGERWRRLEREFGDAGGELAAVLPQADRERLAGFVGWLAAERRDAGRRGIAELLERVIARSGYDLMVLAQPGGPQRWSNVLKLLRIADEYERAHGHDVRGLTDLLTAEIEAAARESDAPVADDGESVRLMTIHAAKGLEWDVVCVADLGRGRVGSAPRLLTDGERLGFRARGADGKSYETGDYAELVAARRLAEREEEQRVFHVAVTRARERLILSGPLPLPKDAAAGGWLLTAFVPQLAELLEQRPDGDLDVVCPHPERPDDPGVRVVARRTIAQEAPAGPGAADPSPQVVRPAADVPPQRPPAAPATLSYSTLTRFERCHYRYHLQSRLGLPENRFDPLLARRPGPRGADGLQAHERGTLVHELLALVPPQAPAAPAAARTAEVAARLGLKPVAADLADARALVEQALGAAVLRRAFACPDVRYEHPFACAVADDAMPLLHGFIDVLALDGAAALVIDYKTDAVSADTDLEALTEEHYGAQRRIYALAALAAGARTVEVAHLYIKRAGQPATAHYVAADAGSLREEIRARAGLLVAGAAEPSEHPGAFLCRGCPGRGGLCPHPEELTSRWSE